MRRTEPRPSAIDLFCGIGGLSYGLAQSGIDVVAGVDSDPACQYAFEHNVHADFLLQDVNNVTGKDIVQRYWRNPDRPRILAGCAPCQPFSPHMNKIKNRKQTKRWRLLGQFRRIVEETQPDIVTMENVPNLANQGIFNAFVNSLKCCGYFVTYSNVYCPDYGVPQRRRRLVLLASRHGPISLIAKTHSPEEYATVRQAISHLPPVRAGEASSHDPLHRTMGLTDINLRRIKASRPNGTWLDWSKDLQLRCHRKNTGSTYKAVYGRMHWDEPSPTITTQFYNYGTGRFGHPAQNRALTVREAALLQTFPERYTFCEMEGDIPIKPLAALIGNAVPVELAKAIGKSILIHLGDRHARHQDPLHV